MAHATMPGPQWNPAAKGVKAILYQPALNFWPVLPPALPPGKVKGLLVRPDARYVLQRTFVLTANIDQGRQPNHVAQLTVTQGTTVLLRDSFGGAMRMAIKASRCETLRPDVPRRISMSSVAVDEVPVCLVGDSMRRGIGIGIGGSVIGSHLKGSGGGTSCDAGGGAKRKAL